MARATRDLTFQTIAKLPSTPVLAPRHCSRCFGVAEQDSSYLVQGAWVCGACARRLRVRVRTAFGLLLAVTVPCLAAGTAGVMSDWHNGLPDWWLGIPLVAGTALGLVGVLLFVVARMRAANRQTATHLGISL